MIRTAWALMIGILATLFSANGVILAGVIGLKDREGGVYDFFQNSWARLILWATGVTVVVHGSEHLTGQEILVGNHVSWFDVFAVAGAIPRCRFVAKHEVRSIPFIGRSAEVAGHVYIERENRKAALEQYKDAAVRIHTGTHVVVFAEGTRGNDYALRPFKKGPFVLAVSAQVPIVPMLIYGTMPVMPKGQWLVRPGTVHIHFLPAVTTRGLTYDDRNVLAVRTRNAMAELLEREYGVKSLPWNPRGGEAPSS